MTDQSVSVLTDDDLNRLEAQSAAASPGPWETRRIDNEYMVHAPPEERHDPDGTVGFTFVLESCYDFSMRQTKANYELIATMRNSIAALVAEVRAARSGQAGKP